MKRIKALVSALLALALIGVCGLAFAEDAEEAEDLYFTPGEDLVLIDSEGIKVTLMGEQPEKIYEDGELKLNFTFENKNPFRIDLFFRGTFNGVASGPDKSYRPFNLNSHEANTISTEYYTAYSSFPKELDDCFESIHSFSDLKEMQLSFYLFKDSDSEWRWIDTGVIHFGPDDSDELAEESNEEAYAPLDVGSRGDEVKALQEKLIELGYLDGGADGIYGKGTAGAVRKFQAAEGLPETGAADSATQARLFSK